MTTQLSEAQAHALREMTGAMPEAGIQVIPGDHEPVLVGHRGRYVTRAGRRVRSLRGYRRRSYGGEVWQPPTERIVVGDDWLHQYATQWAITALDNEKEN